MSSKFYVGDFVRDRRLAEPTDPQDEAGVGVVSRVYKDGLLDVWWVLDNLVTKNKPEELVSTKVLMPPYTDW